jgi:hypothetical protein
MQAKARQTLNSAIDYTYRVGVRLDKDRAAVEARTLALRLLSLAKEGYANLDAASIMSFGLCHSKYLRRTAERIQFMNDQLARCVALCIPDYCETEARHAALVKAARLRRQQSQGGLMHAESEPWETRSEEQKPLHRLSGRIA